MGSMVAHPIAASRIAAKVSAWFQLLQKGMKNMWQNYADLPQGNADVLSGQVCSGTRGCRKNISL